MLHFNAGQAKDSGACAQLSLALSPFYLSPPGFGVDGHGLGRDAAEDEHDVLHIPRWPFHAAEVAAHHAGRARRDEATRDAAATPDAAATRDAAATSAPAARALLAPDAEPLSRTELYAMYAQSESALREERSRAAQTDGLLNKLMKQLQARLPQLIDKTTSAAALPPRSAVASAKDPRGALRGGIVSPLSPVSLSACLYLRILFLLLWFLLYLYLSTRF